MKVEIDVSDIDTRKTDDRGRITLGSELADKRVTVAVLEVEGDDE